MRKYVSKKNEILFLYSNLINKKNYECKVHISKNEIIERTQVIVLLHRTTIIERKHFTRGKKCQCHL